MLTVVLAEAVMPRSSETLHVTAMGPGPDPAAVSTAVELFPAIDPALEE
jgi:hypothetical protein